MRFVADEVWQQLDPYAGQLAERTVRRLRFAIAVAAALTLAVVAVWWSGVIVPRVSWPPKAAGWSWSTGPDTVEHDVLVLNRGRRPIEVAGIGRSGTGLPLVAVHGALPATLRPGQTMEVRLVYRVTDCAAVTDEPWPVPVRIQRPWGIYTAYVAVPTHTSPDAPAVRSFTDRDPYAVEWQRALADRHCADG
ncbi:MAG TPA: hypothetical protein VFR67_14300 [Pilimelia sp.]|nr:hypothetical protein [Pilimelia sp.]